MIVVIDYKIGNVGSICNMLKKVGAPAVLSADPEVIKNAVGILLPGVGAFDQGMANLEQTGLIPQLTSAAFEKKVPFLGICLGMQMLSRKSEEGALPGLGWIAADTKRFNFKDVPHANHLKIPHMGWNEIEIAHNSILTPFSGEFAPRIPRYYFVHSYHLACDSQQDVAAWCTYGYRFAAVVARGNIWGAQFHPEKSHRFGVALLRYFWKFCQQQSTLTPISFNG